ncbi:S8 family peptidase [Alkalicoccobacillus porphyridii]|uniref:S8 family serine peptidase n=1 Tax=Alkalicoccobacillus porphyridii TaxID=2597270 RepID=A0A553ZV34_9BACI|nr:S8 family peptidase [Alkalicoccobacillus porphyridii]TSB45351.1 S8 family serine peptidase [Alkalicoccobacillus porphyridii]
MNRKVGKLVAGLVCVTALLTVTTEASAAEEKVKYLIGFEKEAELEAFANEVEQVGVFTTDETQRDDETIDVDIIYDYDYIPVLSVEIDPEDVEALSQEEGIAYIEEDFEVSIQQTVPWGIQRVQAPAVINRGINGSGVRVAVLDSGISSHSDLSISGGVSFVPGEPTIADGNGHGTHVAGTIAALNNSIGVVGVAPNAQIYGVKVLGANGRGSVSGIAQGLEWAATNNMDIANLSLGSDAPSSTLEQAVNFATSRGVLVVAASGNNGSGNVGYPARYANAMAVGATDQNNRRANFSQYGAGLDIVAPGVGVQSTYPGNRYVSMNGTSMASPHVAGAAALVKQRYPSWSNTQIRNHLKNTATNLGNTNQFGSGLVNADAATR